jgi:DNA-binding transcriptional LysR family regulator
MRYFLAVAEEQSFTRAAARIHIEPSPLSRAIAALESEFDTRLLYRGKGKIRLTFAGEVFQEEARRMLAFMDGARVRVQSAAKGFHGVLRVGLADGLAQPRLSRLLARCREEEPLTGIWIVEMTVAEMLKALDHDQIDAGITIHAGLDKSLVREETLWTDRPVVAIPRNHPLLAHAKIPLREIIRQPLILYHPESCTGGYDVIRRWFGETGRWSPVIAAQASGQESMLMFVAAGYGIGVGLRSQLALYNHPEVVVRPVADDVPSTSVFIVTPDRPDRPLSNELNRFIDRARRIGRTAAH